MVTRWPRASFVASVADPAKGRAWWKKGPTVWDGVGPGTLELHRRPVAPAQHDVEPVPQRPLRAREGEIEGGHEPGTRPLVGHGVEDRIEGQERVAGEEHLGDE